MSEPTPTAGYTTLSKWMGLRVCVICAAVVPSVCTDEHDEWHAALAGESRG